MNYTLLVLSSPTSIRSSRSAVMFAQAVIERGHCIKRVFFLDDGVQQAISSQVTPQDEFDASQAWSSLASEHNTELVVCISSALKRGVLDDTESQRHEKNNITLHPAFTIGGLGLLVDAAIESDRLITFGG